MDKAQQQRFRRAVDRKREEAEAASHQKPDHSRAGAEGGIRGSQESLTAADQPPDTLSVREKSSGKGHKTADKWNQ